MWQRTWRFASALLLFVIVAAGVALLLWRIEKPSPPIAPLAILRRVTFADLPSWKETDLGPAMEAFQRSCAVLNVKPAGAKMGVEGYAGTVADWRGLCARVPQAGANAAATRAFFESAFLPLEIRRFEGSEGPFTGYYEPELAASRTAHGNYRTPIYGLPMTWVRADLGAFRQDLGGEHVEGCVHEHRFLPCPARAEIDAHGLADTPILLYANDPISVFFLHIQGSGRARLDDGSMVRLAYAGQNGWPYTPVGRVLIARGLLDRKGMSMQAIRAWLEANPGEAQNVMNSDQSYVFFSEKPMGDIELGSPGTEGVPLTPRGSLAVDPRIHPLGAPFYIVSTRPDPDPRRPDHPFRQLLIAQDTGGAIRGPARGDVFWGYGQDAESIAGRMKAAGRMFVFVPRTVAARFRTSAELHGP